MSKKRRMLAEVLWEAANVNLSHDGWWRPAQSDWSCNAVAKAVTGNPDANSTDLPKSVDDFLRSFGCRTGKGNYSFGVRLPIKRQGIRYMWLLLAMHAAEDEGITL